MRMIHKFVLIILLIISFLEFPLAQTKKGIGSWGTKPSYFTYQAVRGSNTVNINSVTINNSVTKTKVTYASGLGSKTVTNRILWGLTSAYSDSVNGSSVTITNLLEDTTYHYNQSASYVKSGGGNTYSKGTDGTFVTGIKTPTNLIATGSIAGITLNWTVTSGKSEKTFIYRSSDNNTFSLIDSSISTTYLNPVNGTYYFKIKTLSPKRTLSTFSNSDSATGIAAIVKTYGSKCKFLTPTGAGSTNGDSWANAYAGFSDVPLSTWTSGDTLIVSGGTTNSSLTYTGSITLYAGNSSSINIVRAWDVDHNGTVYWSPSVADEEAIYIDNRSNFTLDGIDSSKFIFLGTALQSGGIAIRHSSGHQFKNFSIRMTATNNLDVAFWSYNISNSLYENIRIYQPGGSYNPTAGIGGGGNSDGFQFNSCQNNIMRSNRVDLANSHNTPHSDCMQFFGSAYASTGNTVEKNILKNVGTSNSSKQGIYITNSSGDWKIRNNFVEIYQNAWGTAIGFNQYTTTPNDSIIITNNTVNCSTYTNLWMLQVQNHSGGVMAEDKIIIKNNILFGNGAIDIDTSLFTLSKSNVDYNIITSFSGATKSIVYNEGGTSMNWSSWVALGFDAHTYTTDPLLTGYIPSTSGNADNNAVSPTGWGYSNDIIGTVRTNPFWIGCFEGN